MEPSNIYDDPYCKVCIHRITRDVCSECLAYPPDRMRFKRDPDVKEEEDGIHTTAE